MGKISLIILSVLVVYILDTTSGVSIYNANRIIAEQTPDLSAGQMSSNYRAPAGLSIYTNHVNQNLQRSRRDSDSKKKKSSSSSSKKCNCSGQRESKVCGTDRKTYKNTCEFNCALAKNRSLRVRKTGSC